MQDFYVTIAKAEELTGYTQYAIRTKIARGVWLEGRQWRRAPDGRVLLSLIGITAWVEGRDFELPVMKVSETSLRAKVGSVLSKP
jgi:hypothetical protein